MILDAVTRLKQSMFETAPIKREIGSGLILDAKNGVQVPIVTVPDLDLSPFCLPFAYLPLDSTSTVPQVLSQRGINSFLPMSWTESDMLYFAHSLIYLPLPLAVHATFNFSEKTRPDLSIFKENLFSAPLIGVTAPPGHGKTLLLSTLAMLESDSHLGIRDGDQFNRRCLNNVLSLAKSSPDAGSVSKSPQDAIDFMTKVYNQANAFGAESLPPPPTLRQMFDSLLSDYVEGNPRIGYLLDLPGENPKKDVPKHIYQLLRFAIPTINLTTIRSKSRGLNVLTLHALREKIILPDSDFNHARQSDHNLRKNIADFLISSYNQS